MTTKILFTLACAAAIAAAWLPLPKVSAQAAEIPPVPAPTPGAEIAPSGPMALITMNDGTGLTLKLRGKYAPRILLRAGRVTTITLRYDPSYAGSTLEVAALDAGKVTFAGNRNVVAPNGMAILQFSDAQRPGLYRLAINCGGIASTLQFWVPDPDNPAADASVLVPTRVASAAANSQ